MHSEAKPPPRTTHLLPHLSPPLPCAQLLCEDEVQMVVPPRRPGENPCHHPITPDPAQWTMTPTLCVGLAAAPRRPYDMTWAALVRDCPARSHRVPQTSPVPILQSTRRRLIGPSLFTRYDGRIFFSPSVSYRLAFVVVRNCHVLFRSRRTILSLA